MNDTDKHLEFGKETVQNLRSLGERVGEMGKLLEAALQKNAPIIELARAGSAFDRDAMLRATLTLVADLVSSQKAAMEIGRMQIEKSANQLEQLMYV